VGGTLAKFSEKEFLKKCLEKIFRKIFRKKIFPQVLLYQSNWYHMKDQEISY
jgi:hypothetical protein